MKWISFLSVLTTAAIGCHSDPLAPKLRHEDAVVANATQSRDVTWRDLGGGNHSARIYFNDAGARRAEIIARWGFVLTSAEAREGGTVYELEDVGDLDVKPMLDANTDLGISPWVYVRVAEEEEDLAWGMPWRLETSQTDPLPNGDPPSAGGGDMDVTVQAEEPWQIWAGAFPGQYFGFNETGCEDLAHAEGYASLASTTGAVRLWRNSNQQHDSQYNIGPGNYISVSIANSAGGAWGLRGWSTSGDPFKQFIASGTFTCDD